MAIDLVTKYLPYVDEIFTKESKKSLLTNQDFEWTGAHTVKVYKITTADMEDYGRSGPKTGNWSRYGAIQGLDATTEEMTLTKDRSFTFAIDTLSPISILFNGIYSVSIKPPEVISINTADSRPELMAVKITGRLMLGDII